MIYVIVTKAMITFLNTFNFCFIEKNSTVLKGECFPPLYPTFNMASYSLPRSPTNISSGKLLVKGTGREFLKKPGLLYGSSESLRYCCYVRQAMALSCYTSVKNTSRSTEKTDNTPIDKTEHVTLGMKQSFSFQFFFF